MKRAFTLFLCLLCIGVVFFAPALIQAGLHKNIYSIRAEKRAENYTGTLQLWHIVSFKTGGQSGVSYLNDHIRRFEKSNPYVYIEITGLTVSEANEKLAAGEQPDIISYPLGFFDDAAFLAPLEAQDSLASPYKEVGVWGNTLYAYPYMADFYVLSCNQDKLFAADVTAPTDNQLQASDLDALLAAFDNTANTVAITDTVGLSPLMALSYLRPNGKVTQPFASTNGLDSFLDGESPLLLSTAAEAEKLAFDKRAATLNIHTYALSDYTDAVQLISVATAEDSSKQTMCTKFAVSLLSSRAQTNLAAVQLLPTTIIPDLFQDKPLYSVEYAYMLQNAVVPNSFSYRPGIAISFPS